MSLASAVAGTRKSNTTSSEKNPAYYNRMKNSFIHNMCTHEDPEVRIAALTDECCPTTKVNSALAEETDQDVLRAILMSDGPSIKAITTFADSPRGDLFDDDPEVEKHITQRITGDDDSESASDDGGLDEDDEL